jgi:hypothetical protein
MFFERITIAGSLSSLWPPAVVPHAPIVACHDLGGNCSRPNVGIVTVHDDHS